MRQFCCTLFIVVAAFSLHVPEAGAQAQRQAAAGRTLLRITRQMPPLRHPRGDRWPVLFSGGPPTDPRFFEVYVDRGITPICNVRLPKDVRAVAPYLRYLQLRRMPIVLMGGGLVQAAFRESAGGCPHMPPAQSDAKGSIYACPSWLYENPLLNNEANVARQLAQSLRNHNIEVSSIWIDFEAGAYLRNRLEKEDAVRVAMAEALKCPRCVGRFGEANLSTPQKYQDVVDKARAHALRTGLSDPIRSTLPQCRVANFDAHPVRRQERFPDRFPAYGWTDSGLTVAQPRCYIVPGFRGGNANQEHVDWNIFLYCVREFSHCAKVLQDDEILVPWLGYLFTRKSDAAKRAKKGFKLASPAAYQEMVIHSMLRGTETMAIFTTHSAAADFNRNYPDDFDTRGIGPFLVNVLDVQQGYDTILGVDDMVRHGQPLTYDIQGQYNTLDENAAVWSGVASGDEAIIRTVSFGKPIEKTIRVFNRDFVLPFERRGKFYRIDSTGAIERINARRRNR